jgi:hypothetical protein
MTGNLQLAAVECRANHGFVAKISAAADTSTINKISHHLKQSNNDSVLYDGPAKGDMQNNMIGFGLAKTLAVFLKTS